MSKPATNTISLRQVDWRRNRPSSSARKPFEVDLIADCGTRGRYLLVFATDHRDAMRKANEQAKDNETADCARGPLTDAEVAKIRRRQNNWARHQYELGLERANHSRSEE